MGRCKLIESLTVSLIESSSAIEVSMLIVACLVARLTTTFDIPSIFDIDFSTRDTQLAHVIPSTESEIFSVSNIFGH